MCHDRYKKIGGNFRLPRERLEFCLQSSFFLMFYNFLFSSYQALKKKWAFLTLIAYNFVKNNRTAIHKMDF